LQSTLRQAEIPSLRTRQLDSAAQAVSAARDFGFPAVVKALWGDGRPRAAKATSVATMARAFAEVVADADGPPAAVFVQEFADGTEYDVLSAVHGGVTHLLAVVRNQLDRAGSSRIGATAGPQDPLATALADTVERVTDALQITAGLTTVRLRLTPLGPRVINVHAHLPFRHRALLEAVTGLDLGAAAAALALGDPLPATTAAPTHAALAVMRAWEDGTITSLRLDPRVTTAQWLRDEAWHVAAPALVAAGDPLLTVTVSGTDRRECLARTTAAADAMTYTIGPPDAAPTTGEPPDESPH
jgi:biotin carboxylase